jgi:hypothetical protein
MKIARRQLAAALLLGWLGSNLVLTGADARADVGDPLLAEYFRLETAKLAAATLAEPPADLQAWQETHRRQLCEMLGLWPMPERTDLEPVVTGRVEADGFEVERLHFQSMPGLYVTANLYLPTGLEEPAPAILYVCGHGAAIRDGVSFGNKVSYHHHGVWFARHGYVCLVIDTLQLGEIQGIHHGTHRLGQWWWTARGYTPAGVEAWNGIRALDYLESRPEVDASRIGMTGRSGGGAYTWFVSALDERVRVSAPVAGITDLENHVVDGVVEGHCDCMFFVNTYRWDQPLLAALVAPRPLLIANSDKDSIFPLEGVMRVHEKVRRVYGALGAADHLGLLITEGPHRDTQDLQVPVFRWFNRFLQQDLGVVERAAVRIFEPEQLKVFAQLPSESRNAQIQTSFVSRAPEPAVPSSAAEWTDQRGHWMEALREQSFGGWPEGSEPATARLLSSGNSSGLGWRLYEFQSQPAVPLRLLAMRRLESDLPRRVVFHVLNDQQWAEWTPAMRSLFGLEPGLPDGQLDAVDAARLQDGLAEEAGLIVWLAPRGTGPLAWSVPDSKQNQIRRRFYLLGQTIDGMRVWDIRRGIQAWNTVVPLRQLPLQVHATGDMAVNVLMASLFEPGIQALRLDHLPASFQDGPDYLNALRICDVPTVVALAAELRPVQLVDPSQGVEDYAKAVSARLKWETERVRVRWNDRQPGGL